MHREAFPSSYVTLWKGTLLNWNATCNTRVFFFVQDIKFCHKEWDQIRMNGTKLSLLSRDKKVGNPRDILDK